MQAVASMSRRGPARRLALLCVLLLCAAPLGARAQTSSSGTIQPTDKGALTWTGTTVSPGGNTAESSCMDSGPAQSCETYTLTVGGAPADWAGKKVQVLLTWQVPANEYDIYIHKGSNSGTLVTSATQGPGQTTQIATIDPSSAGTGTFTIHVAYDTTPASAADEYVGNVSVQTSTSPNAFVPPAPVAVDPGPAIGYENFEAPGVLTPVTSTSSGVLTVEYLGRGAGEPSVGANWSSGVINYQSDLETLFINFDNSCPATGLSAIWANRRAPTSQLIDSDPIGFTDRQTGRVFAGELTLLSPDTVKISHSDNDGVTWVPDQSGGIASAVDHETIGGGPYHAPLTGTPAYANAVYYCSQDIAAALCSRSDDGGSTYGPSVPIYNLTQCGGLHGHLKVSPVDGTIYLPNRACGNQSAVVVSQDNGVTWTIRPIQDTKNTVTGSSDDPAVSVDANGRVYALFADNGTSPVVATSDDFGATWQHLGDLGAQLGLKNVAFPAAAAGDKNRAAVAFYGTTTGIGNSSAVNFTGLWHLYIAHTFDGGTSWTTTDATPNLPMQRSGLLRGGGGSVTRNLLDFFDMTVDRDGRVVIGYVNGCAGGACAQAAPTATGNGYSATATIARQSSGRRMLAAKDPSAGASVAPGMAFLTQRRGDNVVHLAWNEADSGSAPISTYQILRGTASNAEGAMAIATVPGSQLGYDDLGATDTSKTYFYKVVAVNSAGSSCGNNEVAAPYAGNPCSGILIHQNDPSHPEATGGSVTTLPPPSLLIDSIAVGEPYGATNLMFKMKVGALSSIPPSSRWRMVWDSASSPGEQYYVGMTSDSSSAVSFEYGTVTTQVVGVVLGVPTETFVGAALATSNYKADGTITIYLPKSAVGNPQRGDLLGAVNGRTFTADTPQTNTLERSTLLIDHTFVKGNTDSSYPAATYRVMGNQLSAFAFAQANGVAPGTLVTSPTVTMTDVTDPLPISVSNGEYSINGGAFGSVPGLIAKGDTLTLRQTSAGTSNTATDTQVTVGCYSTSFRSVTGQPGSSSGSSSGSGSSGSSGASSGGSGGSSGASSGSSGGSSGASSGSSGGTSGGSGSSSSSSGGTSSSSSGSSSSGGGGDSGGGGAFGGAALLPLTLGAALRRRRRRQ